MWSARSGGFPRFSPDEPPGIRYAGNCILPAAAMRQLDGFQAALVTVSPAATSSLMHGGLT